MGGNRKKNNVEIKKKKNRGHLRDNGFYKNRLCYNPVETNRKEFLKNTFSPNIRCVYWLFPDVV